MVPEVSVTTVSPGTGYPDLLVNKLNDRSRDPGRTFGDLVEKDARVGDGSHGCNVKYSN